jgi:hypothetical protein
MTAIQRRRRAGAATLAAVALLLAGCGSQEAPDDPSTGVAVPGSTVTESETEGTATESDAEGTATTDDAASTAPGAAAPVELGVGAVGDLALPADADEALEVLVPLLGEPTQDVEAPGCEPSSTMRILWWEEFGLSGQGADAGSVELTSWEVVGDSYPPSLLLPDGLEVGATEDEVLTALPDAEVLGPDGMPHGGKLVRDGDLTVKLSAEDNTLSAVQANIQLVGCD